MPESNAVNDSGTAGGEKAVDEGYRNILLVFDVVFGIFSLSMAVLAAASAFMGKTGWFTVVLLGSFVAINLGLSQVSNRVQNRLRLELFRIFIVNGVLGFLAFTRADGPFGHYWPCYLVMSLAAGKKSSLICRSPSGWRTSQRRISWLLKRRWKVFSSWLSAPSSP
jgi:hypothetical protein